MVSVGRGTVHVILQPYYIINESDEKQIFIFFIVLFLHIYSHLLSLFSLSPFLLIYGLYMASFVPFKSWLRDLSAMKLKLKFI